MAGEREELCTALDNLAQAIISAWSSDTAMIENWGWNHPALTRHDLARLATSLAKEIAQIQGFAESELVQLKRFARQVVLAQTHHVPQFFNGNGTHSVPQYMTLLSTIRAYVEPRMKRQLDIERLDPKELPTAVARRVRAVNAELDALVPDRDALAAQIKLIGEAHDAAHDLPVTMEALAHENAKMARLASEADLAAARAAKSAEAVDAKLKEIEHESERAAKLASSCEVAYRITTTQGLAAAFDSRAQSLSRSVYVWVVGLAIALGCAVWLGSERINSFLTLLRAMGPDPGLLWLQGILVVFSVGAPVWFGWIATKQIGQRFRLAEDYAFKASVAKAYEGYRAEAVHLDEQFESRLFAAALTRLEEPPLRYVEAKTHGSPLHEFADAQAVNGMKDAVATGIKDAVGAVASRVRSKPEIAAEVVDKP